MKSMLRNAVPVLATVVIACAPAFAQPSAATQKEIAHLLDHVASPGCQFNRNGTWYEGTKARAHLQDKYDYLVKRKLVTDTESFIERAASSSSMSGKPYLVRCGNGAAMPSAAWLRAELKRLRTVPALAR